MPLPVQGVEHLLHQRGIGLQLRPRFAGRTLPDAPRVAFPDQFEVGDELAHT